MPYLRPQKRKVLLSKLPLKNDEGCHELLSPRVDEVVKFRGLFVFSGCQKSSFRANK